MSRDDGKPRRRRLSDDERTLWDRITRSVLPLQRRATPAIAAEPAASKTKAIAAARPHAVTRHHAASKPLPKAAARSTKPEAKPQAEPELLGRRQKRRLAREIEQIDARIDLHGRTQSEAHAALLGFLRAAQRDGAKFVLVITGKGARARDEWGERGVLRRSVPLWLQLPEFRGYVVGFEPAHIGHGGEGALYVRLRRARSRDR